MNRTNKTTATTIVDAAELSGWDLTFNYTIQQGEDKPKNVSCSGVQKNGIGYINASASNSPIGRSITFNKVEHDESLALSIFDEMVLILG